jgi:hypothetical protein
MKDQLNLINIILKAAKCYIESSFFMNNAKGMRPTFVK